MPAEPPDAFAAALRLLAQRPHTTQELRRKLDRRSCAADQVEEALDRLSQLGYLDDSAFARALVARRGFARGQALIAAELFARGVTRDVAQAALGALSEAEQQAAARRLASRSESLDRRRLAARLQRRGFTADVIRDTLGWRDRSDEGPHEISRFRGDPPEERAPNDA